MQYYFFRSPGKTYARTFRRFAIKQNVATSNILSSILIVVCTLVFILKLFVDYGYVVKNPREYRDVLVFLLTCSAIYKIGYYIIRKAVKKKKRTAYWLLSSYYALILISGFMWLTFIAQHNPRNAMTMFLIGMFGVGVLWIFDFIGTVIISLVTFAVFVLSVHNFQGDHMILWQNYITSFVVLLLFFVISRILYSYHFSYFIQLKTIEEKNKEIQDINHTQTQILNTVAHDLRSPLNSIISLVNIMKDDTIPTEEDRNEYYNMILSECKNADSTIHDLIDTAKKRDGNLVLNINTEGILVNDFLETIYQHWQRKLKANKQLLYQPPEQEIKAAVNKQKLQRVIDNLISNAAKFTKEDGIIQLGVEQQNSHVRISVSDNGIGIPENLKPYLFDRFSKAGRVGLSGEKSYGLGLNICRQIVQEHGGEISVDSKDQNGTTFHIDLPALKN